MFQLTFYGGLRVYLAFQPEHAKPPANLTAELIAGGIPTVITLGEKTYEFNQTNET